MHKHPWNYNSLHYTHLDTIPPHMQLTVQMMQVKIGSEEMIIQKTMTVSALYKELASLNRLEPQEIKLFVNGSFVKYEKTRVIKVLKDEDVLSVVPLLEYTKKSVNRASKSLKKSHQVYFVNSNIISNFISTNSDISGLLRNIEEHIGYYNINYIVAEEFMQIYELFLERENSLE